MILNIYAIYDRLAETWRTPFFLNPKTAQRTFEWMKKDTTAADRQDKEIRCLGTFDQDTARIEVHAYVKVFELGDVEDD